jgi:hypothetical protein
MRVYYILFFTDNLENNNKQPLKHNYENLDLKYVPHVNF